MSGFSPPGAVGGGGSPTSAADSLPAGTTDALVGTSGTPSSSNKFVTDADSRNTDARTPSTHATSHAGAGSDPITSLGACSVTGTQTFSGSTGNNKIALTDNLASALQVSEGSNKYLDFKSTDNDERVIVLQRLVAGPNATGNTSGYGILEFAGTSGNQLNFPSVGGGINNQISMPNNNSSALFFRESSNSDKLTEFVTTTNAKTIKIGSTGNTEIVNLGVVKGQLYTTVQSTATPSGTTQTIDFNSGNNAVLSLASASGNVTLTLSNPVAGGTYTIKVTQGASSRNITWPNTVKWAAGAAPTVSTTNGAIDLFVLYYDGTNYLANFNQAYA